MIRFLLDADIAVYALDPDRHQRVTERVARFAPGEIAISAVTAAEVFLGTRLGKPPPPAVLEAFIAAIPIAPFDEGAARIYATLPFRRARFDRLLAAHALSIGAIVVTNNEVDFSDVPGLNLENWTL